MKSFEPRIEWRDPNALTPYSNNAKTHPREQIDKIAASISGFGFDKPIVIDGDGVIIKGHGRREASLRLGLNKVPVLIRDDLSVAENMDDAADDTPVIDPRHTSWFVRQKRLEPGKLGIREPCVDGSVLARVF